MRKTTGVLLALMLMFSVMLGTSMSVSAATDKTQDGLTVTISTDKESYAANEDINLSITVKNTNTYSVVNVSIEALLPAGLKLKSGALTKNSASLKAGETLTVSAVAVSENPSTTTPSGGTTTPTATQPSTTTPGGGTTTLATTQPKASNAPKTGDDSNIYVTVMLCILSLAGAVVAFKFRKKSGKILSIFMCAVLLSGIVPSNGWVLASSTQKSIDVNKTITVDGNSFDVTAKVNYGFNSVPDVGFQLSVDNDTILIGSGNSGLYFYLETALVVDSISLYLGSTLITEMYDDGNFNLNGDDMAGDGVYSAKFSNFPQEESVQSFIAKSGVYSSNTVNVKYYTYISDEILDIMDTVDEIIEELVLSDSFIAANETERKDMALATLNDLASKGMILADSIMFFEESKLYSFQYIGGSQGGLMIKDFGTGFNGFITPQTN